MAPRRAIPGVLLAAACVALASPAQAQDSGDSGGIAVTPGDQLDRYHPPEVRLDARYKKWSRTGDRDDRSGSGGPVCRYEPITRIAGKKDHPKAADALKRLYPDRYLGSRGGDESKVFKVTCDGDGDGFVVGDGGPGGDAAALPSPAELAERARERLRLPLPRPGMSPRVRLADGRSATLVNEQLWLWTEPQVWSPRSQRVRVGPVWAEVTARPVSMRFDSGMGESGATCEGPGTPYRRSHGLHAKSPDCGFVYRGSSYGRAGERVRAEFTITWSVSWRGSAGGGIEGGELPDMTSRTVRTFAVAEAQSLRAG